MEDIECSETSAIINQTPGNHPKEDILDREKIASCWLYFRDIVVMIITFLVIYNIIPKKKISYYCLVTFNACITLMSIVMRARTCASL
jgi:hypothetical protein